MDPGGRRGAVVIALVVGIQALGWGSAMALSVKHPAFLALCGLAYSLGMRHGLDADHIAAIDNVSRSLIGRGIRPIGLGLYFALGHSSMVTLASLATAGVALRFSHAFDHFREWMSAYATVISSILLLLVAPRNLMAAWRSYRALRDETHYVDHRHSRGALWGWFARPLTRFHIAPWHMFFIGILFGLGFETASAIAVLAITGTQAAGGATWACTLIFPLLFTAGMTLVDAMDAMFVERAYGWAIQRPREQAIYKLSVTGFSAAAALLVGGLELASLVRTPGHVGDGGSILNLVQSHFDFVGAIIVLTLAAIWWAAVITRRRGSRRDGSSDGAMIPGSISTDIL